MPSAFGKDLSLNLKFKRVKLKVQSSLLQVHVNRKVIINSRLNQAKLILKVAVEIDKVSRVDPPDPKGALAGEPKVPRRSENSLRQSCSNFVSFTVDCFGFVCSAN